MFCVNDGRQARYQCSNCLRMLCETCIRVTDIGKHKLAICPFCGGQLTELAEAKPPPKSFWHYLGTAFIYPFMGKGLLLVVLNGIFIGVCIFVSQIAIGIGVLVLLFAFGYTYWLFFNVIQKNALEEDEPPTMPDFEGFGQAFSALFKMIVLSVFWTTPTVVAAHLVTRQPAHLFTGILLVLGGPATLWGYVFASVGGATTFGSVELLAAIGLLMFPMSLLAVATFNSLRGLHPVPLLHTIFRAPFQYLVCCICFYGAIVLIVFLWGMFTAQIKEIGIVLLPIVFVYALFVIGRLLGGLHAGNKERFGWVRT